MSIPELNTDLNSQSKEYNLYSDILFGLSYSYISEGQKLLDLGIGNGSSSVLFYLSGLDIIGLDNSPDMLLECEQKKFATELVYHELDEPFPFEPKSIDHAIACNLFIEYHNFSHIISQLSKILKPGGIFGFNYTVNKSLQNATNKTALTSLIISELSTKYGFTLEKNCSLINHSDQQQIHQECCILKLH